MCGWAIMRAVLMITAKTRSELMAARFINYIYYGAGVVVDSAYIIELVPEQIRGIAVGAYYVSFVSSSSGMSSLNIKSRVFASPRH